MQNYSKSKIGINLAKAKLLKKEQDILYKTIEAYTGLISANEKLEINRANVEFIRIDKLKQIELDLKEENILYQMYHNQSHL